MLKKLFQLSLLARTNQAIINNKADAKAKQTGRDSQFPKVLFSAGFSKENPEVNSGFVSVDNKSRSRLEIKIEEKKETAVISDKTAVKKHNNQTDNKSERINNPGCCFENQKNEIRAEIKVPENPNTVFESFASFYGSPGIIQNIEEKKSESHSSRNENYKTEERIDINSSFKNKNDSSQKNTGIKTITGSLDIHTNKDFSYDTDNDFSFKNDVSGKLTNKYESESIKTNIGELLQELNGELQITAFNNNTEELKDPHIIPLNKAAFDKIPVFDFTGSGNLPDNKKLITNDSEKENNHIRSAGWNEIPGKIEAVNSEIPSKGEGKHFKSEIIFQEKSALSGNIINNDYTNNPESDNFSKLTGIKNKENQSFTYPSGLNEKSKQAVINNHSTLNRKENINRLNNQTENLIRTNMSSPNPQIHEIGISKHEDIIYKEKIPELKNSFENNPVEQETAALDNSNSVINKTEKTNGIESVPENKTINNINEHKPVSRSIGYKDTKPDNSIQKEGAINSFEHNESSRGPVKIESQLLNNNHNKDNFLTDFPDKENKTHGDNLSDKKENINPLSNNITNFDENPPVIKNINRNFNDFISQNTINNNSGKIINTDDVETDEIKINRDNYLSYRGLQKINITDFSNYTSGLCSEMTGNTTYSARLMLNPESLGMIFVVINMNEKAAEIKIRAESQETARVLEMQAQSLKEKLNANGIKLENIDFGNKNEDARQSAMENKENGRKNMFEEQRLRRNYIRSFKNLNYDN